MPDLYVEALLVDRGLADFEPEVMAFLQGPALAFAGREGIDRHAQGNAGVASDTGGPEVRGPEAPPAAAEHFLKFVGGDLEDDAVLIGRGLVGQILTPGRFGNVFKYGIGHGCEIG